MPPSRAARVLMALVPLACVCTTAATQPAEPDWQPVATQLLQAEKPGYGGLCGVVVDHATGTLYLNLSDKGLYRSTDQGKSFERTGTQALKGRTEWPGCLQ